MLHSRLKQIDFLHGFLDGTISFVIPEPKSEQEDVRAVLKPFHYWVQHNVAFDYKSTQLIESNLTTLLLSKNDCPGSVDFVQQMSGQLCPATTTRDSVSRKRAGQRKSSIG